MNYTRAQLVAEWKVRRGLQPLRTDATFTRQDAFEIDEYVGRAIDTAYMKLIETAPVEMLVIEDISDRVTVTQADSSGVCEMKLPPDCHRLVEVNVSGWKRPARIVTDRHSHKARMQQSPFGHGGSNLPIAVVNTAGLVTLYTVQPGTLPVISRVMAVMTPPDGEYPLTRLGLEKLFEFELPLTTFV